MMGGDYHYDPNNDDEADITAIRAAIEMGITHIDTAERYAERHAEELVGQAIKGYDRTKLFIVSKVSPEHLRYEDVIASAKESLERLQTEYLDLYLVHIPNPEIPIEETMRAMDVLLAKGLVKNIGVSNFTIERPEEAQSHTKNRIVANQLHLNLIFREPERKGLLEYCQKNDVMFVAWRPVQKGLLAKRERDQDLGRDVREVRQNPCADSNQLVDFSAQRGYSIENEKHRAYKRESWGCWMGNG